MIQKLVHRNRLPTSPFLVLAAHLRLSLNFVRNSFCNEVDVKNKPRTDSEDKKTLTLSSYSIPTLHNNCQHNLCTNHFRGIVLNSTQTIISFRRNICSVNCCQVSLLAPRVRRHPSALRPRSYAIHVHDHMIFVSFRSSVVMYAVSGNGEHTSSTYFIYRRLFQHEFGCF